MGLALASGGSILEPADIGSIRHRGSFQQLLAEATPVDPMDPFLPASLGEGEVSRQLATSPHPRSSPPVAKSRALSD